ncbi:P-loop NTPase family protein [Flavobacterium geliluteum]|uniref:ATP-binding protein n=1 Tax=Flavobacterium geliluteum TaxID=2816120 RepID=A0A940XDK3_9FLAO|nr:ATP-binding protein [Flavobacterium geliluteum]MBP4139986.1 ATP-binding protein [Flavobacterium geliluteum]
MQKVPRAYSYEDIEKIKFKTIKTADEWKSHLGEPQLGNSHWLVFGGSGHGKTSYVLQAVKQMCQQGQKVHYNTSEEGMKKGFQMALKRNNMKGVSGFNYHQELVPQLTARLSQKRQAKIVVIDSVQYFFRKMRSEHYFEFISQFKDTTFIWISAADGDKLKGAIADDIKFDADIVVKVENYNAEIIKNRFEAYESRVIWQEGYSQKMSKILQKG